MMANIHSYTLIAIFIIVAIIFSLLKDVKRCPYCKHYMHKYGYKKVNGKLYKLYFCTTCGHEITEEVKN